MDLSAYTEHPGVYLGPILMGGVFQAILQGLLIEMTYRYLKHSKGEHRAILAIVIFLAVVSLTQTSAAIWELWITFVTGFGKWGQALSFHWPQKVQTVWQASMAAPVQAYYIWRCFRVMNKNYFVLVPLGMLLASSWATAANTTYRVFQVNFGTFPDLPMCTPASSGAGASAIALSPRDDTSFKIPVDIIFVYWLVSSAVLDLCVTTILTVELWRSKSPSVSGQLNSTLEKLIRGTWETALPPTICALITVITYIVMIKGTTHNIDLFFQEVMGKLYVLSLMITLNSRIEMRRQRADVSYELRPSALNNASVRIEFRTETHSDSKIDATASSTSQRNLNQRPVRLTDANSDTTGKTQYSGDLETGDYPADTKNGWM